MWQDELDLVDTPEMRLWKAVLHRGLKDCFHANLNDMIDAWRWVFKSRSEINSFPVVCEICGANALLIKIAIANRFKKRIKYNDTTKRIYDLFKSEVEYYAFL